MFSAIFCLFFVSAVHSSTTTSKLGSLITEKCPEWGEISADCYANLLNNIISGISQGVPSLGLPPMDPLVITPVNITVSGGSEQEFTMSFHAMNFTGLSKTRVKSIKVGNPMRISLQLPKLKMTSPFTNEGRLILFRAQGAGSLTFNFAKVSMDFNIKYDEEKREGERYAIIQDGNVKVGIQKSNIRLTDLYRANQITKELFNAFLTASSDDIMNAILPTINQAFTDRFLTVARNTVANLPLSQVFKPWEEPPTQI